MRKGGWLGGGSSSYVRRDQSTTIDGIYLPPKCFGSITSSLLPWNELANSNNLDLDVTDPRWHHGYHSPPTAIASNLRRQRWFGSAMEMYPFAGQYSLPDALQTASFGYDLPQEYVRSYPAFCLDQMANSSTHREMVSYAAAAAAAAAASVVPFGHLVVLHLDELRVETWVEGH